MSTTPATATKCDNKCLYADPEQAGDCHCECGGKNHGKGTDEAKWAAKELRHIGTRRAFRAYLNEQEPKSGNRLYRRHRQDFERQYAEWLADHGVTKKDKTKPVDEEEVKAVILKEKKHAGVVYRHVRYSNKKTAYLVDDKVTTKADLPKELGW